MKSGKKKMYDVDRINAELRKHKNSGYYGQWETDRVIASYFDASQVGSCIEVGAADGIRGSNTKYFEEKGWNVLCIEANPLHEKSLRNCRKLVRMYACGESNSEGKLTVFHVGEGNIQSSITSLSPDSRLIEDHKHIINERSQVPIEVRTLNWILGQEVTGTPFEGLQHLDFISVDTEGTELEVLKGLDLNIYKVRILVVENNYNDGDIASYLKDRGYVLDQRYKINDFYLRSDL